MVTLHTDEEPNILKNGFSLKPKKQEKMVNRLGRLNGLPFKDLNSHK